ncbi:hypothetical protein [Clostridium tagluense]|uniref:hypothetical protein n=1 Tax=Clostridium tagluense TaxID=360422 RepID=UPI001CF265F3|nr:hypothetical protein [Clostridium tagluense]MCB2299910.1 hypothetical protein [Clostridium tagluense]
MLVCPICKSEYRDGYIVCSDCECELIEKPEVDEEDKPVKKGSKISQFIMGVLIIICSPVLSHKFTSMYFISNGVVQYNNEQFMWMLKAYQASFLLIAGIICLHCILYWYKN